MIFSPAGAVLNMSRVAMVSLSKMDHFLNRPSFKRDDRYLSTIKRGQYLELRGRPVSPAASFGEDFGELSATRLNLY
jgi:hypothetical protein